MRRREAAHDANGSLPFYESVASQAERIAAIVGAIDRLEAREPRRSWASLQLCLLWVERLQFARSSAGDTWVSRPWSEIAAECRCSEATIRRLVRTAHEAAIVEIREARYVTGGQRPNELRLDIAGCKAFASNATATATVATSRDDTGLNAASRNRGVTVTPSPVTVTPSPVTVTPSPVTVTGPIGNTCFSLAEKLAPPPPAPATATVATSRDDTGRTRWTREEEEEVDCKLFEVGFASRKSLIRRCQVRRIASAAVLDAIATFAANRGRLKGPGAIASWVETGIWPNPLVLPPVEAREVAAAADGRATAAKHQRIVDEAFRRIRKQTPIGTPVDEDQVITLAVGAGVPRPVVRRLRGLAIA